MKPNDAFEDQVNLGGVDVELGCASKMIDYHQIITAEPGKLGGRPCVRGMRISVSDVLGWLSAGMSHEEIVLDFPDLTEEDIQACLAYAADNERQQLAV